LEVEYWEEESETKVFGEVAGLETHEAGAVGAVKKPRSAAVSLSPEEPGSEARLGR
jgi:hypothetical protein